MGLFDNLFLIGKNESPDWPASVEALAHNLVDKSGKHIDLMELAGAYDSVSALKSFFIRCTHYSQEQIADLSKYVNRLDGNDYGFREAAEVRKKLEESTRNKGNIFVKIVSGRKNFQITPSTIYIAIHQNEDGFIWFDGVSGLFKIAGYEWGGPVYDTISQTKGQGKIETAAGSIGIANEYNMLMGKSGKMNITNGEYTRIGKEEVSSIAYMTMEDPVTSKVFTFGFECDSKVHGEILDLLNKSSMRE